MSAVLLVSAGATTAIAVSQSPSDISVRVVTQVRSSDPSGDGQESADSEGSGTSTDTGGVDTGTTSEDASHPRTVTGTTNEDASHPRTVTGTTNEDASHPRTVTGNQPSMVKQPGDAEYGTKERQHACENAGRPWVDNASGGYCGDFGKISVLEHKKTKAEKQEEETAERTVGCLRSVGVAASALLGPVAYSVVSGFDNLENGVAIVENLKSGNVEEAAWKATKYVAKTKVGVVECVRLVITLSDGQVLATP
ncbi:hypothetical protein ACFVZN_04135 [Streptomyces virginiae]|uniref:hypothetical protein n=1 Tax=Streptomyces virginiae TaxID=1961 RepID=UPI00369EC5BC